MAKSKSEQKMTYEEALAELEALAKKIEDPNTEIGKISDYIQKTSELVKYCRDLLRGQEEEIAKLNEQ